MSSGTESDSAVAEAADWHRRLGQPIVSSQTIYDFFSWRTDPVKAEAYKCVQEEFEASLDHQRQAVQAARGVASRQVVQPSRKAPIMGLMIAFGAGAFVALAAQRFRS